MKIRIFHTTVSGKMKYKKSDLESPIYNEGIADISHLCVVGIFSAALQGNPVLSLDF